MAVLTAADMADLVATTQRDLGPPRFQQIAQNLVNYEVFPKWFKRDKVLFEGGTGIQRTLMTKLSGRARHVGLLDTDSVNITDVLTTMRVDWRHLQTDWSLIYQTDILMNSGRAVICNVIKPKRADALISLVEELEDKAWGTAPAVTDVLNPWGIQTWIVENATTGFNGGLPSGYSTLAGVNLTTHPNFKNYTATYTSVTKSDLLAKMRTAHMKIRFKSPVTLEQYRGEMGETYRIYVNESVMQSLCDIGEGQNENLGRDLSSMDGQIVFKKHPIVYVPQLDSRTDNPVYMIDHSTFFPVCLKGDYLRESEAQKAPNQHNVWQVFIDLTYNYMCLDRRRNAVFSTG
jgi:hypothetical protein